MLRDIIIHPNKILLTPCPELSSADLASPEIQSLIDEMIPTMYHAKGVGLAAPQVGKTTRVCVIAKEATPEQKDDLVLVNPTWTKLTKKKISDIEGCLSIPYTFGKVKRYKEIKVSALDKQGNIIEFEAHEFFARVIQHEVDHLDGVLFIDKAREIYIKKDE